MSQVQLKISFIIKDSDFSAILVYSDLSVSEDIFMIAVQIYRVIAYLVLSYLASGDPSWIGDGQAVATILKDLRVQ